MRARFAAESTNFAVAPDIAVIMFAASRDRARALDLLEQAYKAHSGNVINIAVDPLYDPLRSEPRFQALVEKLGVTR